MQNTPYFGTFRRERADSFRDGRLPVADHTIFWDISKGNCRQFQGWEGPCCRTHHLLGHFGRAVPTVSGMGGSVLPNTPSFRIFRKGSADSFRDGSAVLPNTRWNGRGRCAGAKGSPALARAMCCHALLCGDATHDVLVHRRKPKWGNKSTRQRPYNSGIGPARGPWMDEKIKLES